MNRLKTIEQLIEKYPMIPESAVITLVEYRDRGCPTGGFLEAVLSNDLMKALASADDISVNILLHYGRFIYNDLPMSAHGSPDRYKSWLMIGGLNSKEEISPL